MMNPDFLNDQLAKLKILQQQINSLQQAQAANAIQRLSGTVDAELQQRVSEIKNVQDDRDFLKKQKAKSELKKEETRKRAEARKRKAAADKALGLPPTDPRKQAREVIKARKQKRAIEALKDDRKALPPRVGGPNLEGKIRVRIDHKTEIWVNPGTDIEALKKKYLKRDTDIIPSADNIADKAFIKPKVLLPGEIYDLVRLGEM